MKRILPTLLLTPLLAASLIAQDAAPAGRGAAARRPGGVFERALTGGEEGGPLVRLLDNPRLAERINLTERQRTAIQADVEELDAELEVLRPHLEEAAQAQAELLRGPDPDEAVVLAAVEETWRLRTEAAKIQTRKMLAVRSHLTDEQLDSIQEMVDGMRERIARAREGAVRPGARPERPARPEQPPADVEQPERPARPARPAQPPAAGGEQPERPERPARPARPEGAERVRRGARVQRDAAERAEP